MRTHEEGKPQLANMSSMKESVHFFKVWFSGFVGGKGYAEIQSTVWFRQKVLMVLETLLHWEVDSISTSLCSLRLKVSD